MKKFLAFLTILASLFLFGANANAEIIISRGLEGGSGDVDNVLFNRPDLLILSGYTVQGITNQGDYIVDFANPGEVLRANGGQARIEAADGGFNHLEIAMDEPNLGFEKIQFAIRTPNRNAKVTLTFFDQDGLPWVSEDVSLTRNAINFFTAIATEESLILSALIGTTMDMSYVEQVRLGGITTVESGQPVPEPATMLLLGSGLIGLAGFGRKKLFKK